MVQMVVPLGEEQYNQDVTDFATNLSKDSNVWTLKKTISTGIIAKQSVICHFSGGHLVNRQAHFIYNRKCHRLELWFMFYCRDGRPLRVKEFAKLLGTDPENNDSIVIELSTHPTLQIPYYRLYENPDEARTNVLMNSDQNSSYKNYIVRWIEAFGAEVGLTSAPKINSDCAETSSSSSHSVTGSDDS